MLVPQLANWLIFFGLATILVLNFVTSARAYRGGTKQLITSDPRINSLPMSATHNWIEKALYERSIFNSPSGRSEISFRS